MAKSNLKPVENNYITQFPLSNALSVNSQNDIIHIFLLLNNITNISVNDTNMEYKFRFLKNENFFNNYKIENMKNNKLIFLKKNKNLFYESDILLINHNDDLILFFHIDYISKKKNDTQIAQMNREDNLLCDYFCDRIEDMFSESINEIFFLDKTICVFKNYKQRSELEFNILRFY